MTQSRHANVEQFTLKVLRICLYHFKKNTHLDNDLSMFLIIIIFVQGNNCYALKL